ncbi:MAG: glycosyltransferase [Gammaproteobacteria bacterium]|nr:glycosyltransferase [Gammaproteobacteria bacterium]
MRFSIVIPSYNYGEFLPRALDSVLSQEGDDYEVILVDDGSTDDTQERIQAYRKQLYYFRQANQGTAAARNRGVDMARGDYLIFLDADDCLLPGALGYFRQVLQAHVGVDVLIGGYVSTNARGRQRRHPGPRLDEDRLANFIAYIEGKLRIPTGAALWRRQVFHRLHFPEALQNYEDTVVEAQALACFYCIGFPNPVVEVHDHPGRKRDNISGIRESGDQVVTQVFDPVLLPPRFMGRQKQFESNHLLNLARAHYYAKDYAQTIALYHRALAARPINILKWPHLRKYLRALFWQRTPG